MLATDSGTARADDGQPAQARPALSERAKDLLSLLGALAPYCLWAAPVFTWKYFVTWDNLREHFGSFTYFAVSLLEGFGFPRWYPPDGGVPVGMTFINNFNFMPHRLLGYLFAAAFPAAPDTAYLLSLTAGMLLTGFGFWLCLRLLTRSRAAWMAGTWMVLLGGSGLTVFHQEQVLATMFYCPWLLLALLKSRREIKYVPVLGLLCGLTLCTHYPHIFVLGGLVLLISCLLLRRRETLDYARSLLAPRRHAAFTACALVLLLAAASPSYYILSNVPHYGSALRGREIAASTLAQYKELNHYNMSQPVERLKRYLFPLVPAGASADYRDPRVEKSPDEGAAYVTLTGLCLALAALGAARGPAGVIALFTLGCLWLNLGIHAGAAQALFVLKFPTIGGFRQYYHFFPLVNFGLALLGAFGADRLARAAAGKKNPALSALLPLLCCAMLAESGLFFQRYFDLYLKAAGHGKAYSVRGAFGPILRDSLSVSSLRVPLGASTLCHSRNFIDAAYLRLMTTNMAEMPAPFLTGTYFYGRAGEAPPAAAQRRFTVAALPAIIDYAAEPVPGAEDAAPLAAAGTAAVRNDVVPQDRYKVTPRGFSLRAEAGAEALLVLPFTQRLRLRCALDGAPARTVSLWQGALTGLFVPAGRSEVVCEVPYSRFHFFLALYLLLNASALAALGWFLFKD